MENIINKILVKKGKYSGNGVNHDGQVFKGMIIISSLLQSGASIEFIATSLKGEVFHQEKTWIANDLNNTPKLWTINNNVPSVVVHDLRKINRDDTKTKLLFGFGDIKNTSIFREEISLELFSNNSIGYHYSWGLPGGQFKSRSGLVMKKH